MARLDISAGRGALQAMADNTARTYQMYQQGMHNAFSNLERTGMHLMQWQKNKEEQLQRQKDNAFREAQFNESNRRFNTEFDYKKAQDKKLFDENKRINDRNFTEEKRRYNQNYALQKSANNAQNALTFAKTQGLHLANQRQAFENGIWGDALEEVEVPYGIPTLDDNGNPKPLVTKKMTALDRVLEKQQQGMALSGKERLMLGITGMGGNNKDGVEHTGDVRGTSSYGKLIAEATNLEKLFNAFDNTRKNSNAAGFYNGLRTSLYFSKYLFPGFVGRTKEQDALATSQNKLIEAALQIQYGNDQGKAKIEEMKKTFALPYQSKKTLENVLNGHESYFVDMYEAVIRKMELYNRPDDPNVKRAKAILEDRIKKIGGNANLAQEQDTITRYNKQEAQPKQKQVTDYLLPMERE